MNLFTCELKNCCICQSLVCVESWTRVSSCYPVCCGEKMPKMIINLHWKEQLMVFGWWWWYNAKNSLKKKEVIDNHANSWLPYVDKKKAVQIDEKVLQIKVNQRTRKWTTKHRLLKYFYRNFMGVTIVVGFKVYCLVFVWSQCLVCWIGVRSLFKTSVVGWSMFGSSLDGFLFSICDEKVLHDRYSFIFIFLLFIFLFF